MGISSEGRHGLPPLRDANDKRQRGPEGDDDEEPSHPSPKKRCRSAMPTLNYSEEEARAAMRPELVSTPELKSLVEYLVSEMVDKKQGEGRLLSHNQVVIKVKGRMKGGQVVLVGLKGYLLAEAFIRTDIWTHAPHDWFDLTHKTQLEKEFRDKYWESNQRSHAARIVKMARSVKPPEIRSDSRLASNYHKKAVDFISRSVFVRGPGHPIIRSAVAIMVLAENEDTTQSQETEAKVAQIWTAWCLAKLSEGDEIRFLAATIHSRMAKNQTVKTCFSHLNNVLRQWAKDIDPNQLKKWQFSHGRCHFIPDNELWNRPVATPAPGQEIPPSPKEKNIGPDNSARKKPVAPRPTAAAQTSHSRSSTPVTKIRPVSNKDQPSQFRPGSPQHINQQAPIPQMQPSQAAVVPDTGLQPVTNTICIPRGEYNDLLTLRYRDPPVSHETKQSSESEPNEAVLRQLRCEVDAKITPLANNIDEIAEDQHNTREKFVSSCNEIKDQVDYISQNHGEILERQREELRHHSEIINRHSGDLRRDGKDIRDLQKMVDEHAKTINEQAKTINEQAKAINEQAKTINDVKAQLGILLSRDKRQFRGSTDRIPVAPAAMTPGRQQERPRQRPSLTTAKEGWK